MAANPAQLIRIARLRRFVGVFARGGDPDSAAEALTRLASVSRTTGLTAEALRRARQAAQLTVDHETGEAGVRALLHLGSLCLDTGAPQAAVSAAELARERAATLPAPAQTELTAAAALLAGIGHSMAGADEEARVNLSEARDLLVAIHQPAAAALALVQQGLLDVSADRIEGAELCFAFARDFYRIAELPVATVEVAAVAARAFSEVENWERAQRWFVTAIAEADVMGAPQLAAEVSVDYAAELERAEQLDDARRVTTDAAQRCSLLADSEIVTSLRSSVRLQMARLAEDPREALRHIEAVFEHALARRDGATLGLALDLLVSGVVRDRFAPGTWRLVEEFRDRLTGAAFDALALTAATALADLKR